MSDSAAEASTARYVYSDQILPHTDTYYRWSGWASNVGAISVNAVLFVNLNNDGRLDVVIPMWQPGRTTWAPLLNRLIFLESQADGTYSDTTLQRFRGLDTVSLGAELGGVSAPLPEYGDINRDGQVDMIFALNRDDGRPQSDDALSGSSYPTAVMSQPDGTYAIEQIAPAVWNYFAQLVNLGTSYQAWFSQIGYYTPVAIYGNSTSGTVDGQPSYAYNLTSKTWSVAGAPPVSASFNVLPQHVVDGQVVQTLAMLWSQTSAFDASLAMPGASYRIPRPALMGLSSTGDWGVESVSSPFDYQPVQFTMDGQGYTGMVANDGANDFALIEYFYRPGWFELFPGSAPVVIASRSGKVLSKDGDGSYVADPSTYNTMDFYALGTETIDKLPVKIVGEQKDLSAWSFRYLDFNQDGLTDIVVEGSHSNAGPQDPVSGAPAVYLNTGAGVFVHLAESIFPTAPAGWVRYSMSQVFDANGDGIYDVLYYPNIANPQFYPVGAFDWRLYLGSSSDYSSLYGEAIDLTDRMQSCLIRTQAGDDSIADVNSSKSATVDGGAGYDTMRYSSASGDYLLRPEGSTWVVSKKSPGLLNDSVVNIECLQFSDKQVIIQATSHGSYSDLPDALYQFFITAFGAAPGVTYMNQLAEAYRWFNGKEADPIKTIVDIFTSKSQFTDLYPTTLDAHSLAIQLVDRIVRTSATHSAKTEAANEIQWCLENDWSVGDVIHTVFGNLATKSRADSTWGNTAKQFANEIVVAKYYTDTLSQSTTDLATLREILAEVSASTDVSSDEVVAHLIGVALINE